MLASQWKHGTVVRAFSQKKECYVCVPSLPLAPPGSLPDRAMFCRKFPEFCGTKCGKVAKSTRILHPESSNKLRLRISCLNESKVSAHCLPEGEEACLA